MLGPKPTIAGTVPRDITRWRVGSNCGTRIPKGSEDGNPLTESFGASGEGRPAPEERERAVPRPPPTSPLRREDARAAAPMRVPFPRRGRHGRGGEERVGLGIAPLPRPAPAPLAGKSLRAVPQSALGSGPRDPQSAAVAVPPGNPRALHAIPAASTAPRRQPAERRCAPGARSPLPSLSRAFWPRLAPWGSGCRTEPPR